MRRFSQGLAMGLSLAVLAGSASFASSGAQDAAQRGARLERWLRERPTPGVEVLLTEAAGDPRVDAHWRASLSHAEPLVRGAAARAIRAAGRVTLLADVDAALAAEADPLAASELADASIELSERLDTRVLEAVRKWPDPLAPLVTRTVARRVPAALPDLLVALTALEVPVADPAYAEALAYVWRRDPAIGLATCDRLARQGAVTSWRIIVGAHARMRQPISLPLLTAFISAPGARAVDAAMSDYLASALGPRGDRAAVGASRAAIESLLPATDRPEVRTFREVLARTAGDAASADLGVLAAQLGRSSPLKRLRFAVEPLLRQAEREKVDTAWGTFDPSDRELPERPLRLGFAEDLPYGVWKSLAASAGCGGQRGLVSVRVTYGTSGRPSRISPPAGLSDGCQRLLVVLARVSSHLGEGEALIGVPVGVSVSEGFASRSAKTPRDMSDAGEGDGEWRAPTARHSVTPTYPFPALQDQVSGRVWLDIVIDEAGRVRTARVIRGVDVRLDAESLLTMLEWRFGAARLHGWNVPAGHCRDVVQAAR